jgi:hypothetical protein
MLSGVKLVRDARHYPKREKSSVSTLIVRLGFIFEQLGASG